MTSLTANPFPPIILGSVHFGQLTPPEQRTLGALIEKRWTTPDQYPLSINALRLACNQLTNRDPVTDYDEATVREAAQRLSRYGLARLASGHGSRAIKYRHLAEEALSLGREELAVLAVLLLRGPQTRGRSRLGPSEWPTSALRPTCSACWTGWPNGVSPGLSVAARARRRTDSSSS